jgi:hypothetical protein
MSQDAGNRTAATLDPFWGGKKNEKNDTNEPLFASLAACLPVAILIVSV